MPPPDEARALDALKTIQAISAPALDALITAEIGNPMLGVLKSLARAQFEDADPDTIARTVHLMVLAYLLRREVERPPARKPER